MGILFARELNKNYGLEISFTRKIRNFSDGITFFEFIMNWDRYLDDHTPSFEIRLTILNFIVFEFTIYYLHHRDDEDEYSKSWDDFMNVVGKKVL